jgi:hypothetical protein
VIVRFLLFFAVFWLISKVLKMMTAPARRPDPRPSWPGSARVDGGELVQDPRCGVYVPKATAVKGRNGACFCSEACRDAYESGNA